MSLLSFLRHWPTLGSYTTRKNIHTVTCVHGTQQPLTTKLCNGWMFTVSRNTWFWIMPPIIWHSSSLLHIQGKFTFSKVSVVCTKSISGCSTCKAHSKELHHTAKPYDIQSNTTLFHQLWLLQQLTNWASLQNYILTPWNDTNTRIHAVK